MSKPWHMASVRQRQPVRRYKPVGPVGEQPLIDWGGARVDSAHRCCGMHVCSCPPVYVPHMFRPVPAPPDPVHDGRYRCHRCMWGESCVYADAGLKSCQQILDECGTIKKRHEAERERRGS